MARKSDDYTEIVDAELNEDGPSSEIARFLSEEMPVTPNEGMASYRQQIMDILSAESVDAVLTPLEAERLADYTDQPMTVHSYSIQESDFDNHGHYASLTVTLDSDGSKHILNCGHQTVVAQAIALERLNGYPAHVFAQEAKKPNKHGTYMLRLHQVES